ncbi:unnamed protein product [Diamesa serratosioi]
MNIDASINSLDDVDLFPYKLNNLHGREVSLAIFNYNPYTLWKVVSLSIDGTEGWVFLEFCKKFNCSLMISLDEDGEWGEIFDNRSGNGIIGAVAERRAEIGVGALYSWYHESLYLSLSKPITRTGITCITPKPRLLDSWRTPVLPFSTYLWLGVITTFVVSVFAMKLFNDYNARVHKVTMKVHETFRSESFAEVLHMVLGIYVLQAVKMHYEQAIDTVQELADSKMEWGSTHDAWIFSIQSATQPVILELLSKFRTYSKEVLEERSAARDMSFSIERLPYGHYAIGEYITEKSVNDYQTMINDIYYEYCLAMATKTWPLMTKLDDLILRIAESGVQQFVELDVVMKNSNNKIQLGVANSRHRENLGPIKLKPSHLTGAFILLGFGLTISSFTFIFEFCFKKKI